MFSKNPPLAPALSLSPSRALVLCLPHTLLPHLRATPLLSLCNHSNISPIPSLVPPFPSPAAEAELEEEEEAICQPSAMDRYQRMEKPRPESAINENEIRIMA